MTDEPVTSLELAQARLRAAGELAERIAAGAPLEQLLEAIATQARALLGQGAPYLATTDEQRQAVGVRPAGFFLYTEDRRELELYGGVQFPPEQQKMRIPADYGLPGIVVRTGEALVATDTALDPRFKQIISTGWAGSTCQAPVKVAGDILGMTFVASMARNVFWPDDREALKVFAALGATAIRAAGGLRA